MYNIMDYHHIISKYYTIPLKFIIMIVLTTIYTYLYLDSESHLIVYVVHPSLVHSMLQVLSAMCIEIHVIAAFACAFQQNHAGMHIP